MSRIGDNPVFIPDGVSIDIKGQLIVVKGTKGSMDVSIHPEGRRAFEGKFKI